MNINLKEGNIQTTLGSFQRFQLCMDSLPPDIKNRLVSYIESKMDYPYILFQADCQILIEGYKKEITEED